MLVPWVESPFFVSLLPEQCRTETEREWAVSFHRNGYLVLEDCFDDALLDRVVAETEPLFDPSVPDGPRSRVRLQDAWSESPAVREVATDAGIEAVLRFLYRRRPIPFQTLNFRYGSEQRAHTDALHFYSFPPRFMCGVWVALEDVEPDNGALFYYPGSSRLPHTTFVDLGFGSLNPGAPEAFDRDRAYASHLDFLDRLMAAEGLERAELTAKRGSVLIWAAHLVHGGGPILVPGRTRWSQVTHYFFEDCLYYTPMLSNWVTGDLHLRTVVDIHSGEIVANRYGGLEVEGFDGEGTYKLLLDVEDGGEVVRGVRCEHYLLNEVTTYRKAIDAIEVSPSFRLGRALTAPLRLARDLVKGSSSGRRSSRDGPHPERSRVPPRP